MPIKQSSFEFEIPGNKEMPHAASKVMDTAAEIYKPVGVQKIKPQGDGLKKSQRGRMKISDMQAGAGLINIPEDAILFQKSYYSIGAVSEMFNVNASLIRFWENEFDILKPKKIQKATVFSGPKMLKA